MLRPSNLFLYFFCQSKILHVNIKIDNKDIATTDEDFAAIDEYFTNEVDEVTIDGVTIDVTNDGVTVDDVVFLKWYVQLMK